MKKIFKCSFALFVLLFLGLTNLQAQVAFGIELLPDGCTYQVSLVPDVDWTGTQAITATAQVTLVVPTGSFELSDFQSINGSWNNNYNVFAPAENPTMDYITFGLTSLGTQDINYITGQPEPLFSFKNEGCNATSFSFMLNDDPFLPPNSENANVGNQITTLGSGNINAWNGEIAFCTVDNDGDGVASCVDPNDENNCIPNNLNCIDKGGYVYYDFNSNGMRDDLENGIANIAVSFTSASGSTTTVYTDENGYYSFDIECTGEFLLEFDVDGYNAVANVSLSESFVGTGSQSVAAVSFQSCGLMDVHLGLIDAEEYCEANPRMVVPVYVNGDPLGGGTSATKHAFVGFEYDRNGEGTNYQTFNGLPVPGSAGLPDSIASAEQIGATWGNTWDTRSQTIFTSAVVRRHSGFGPLGIGGIYAINYPVGSTPIVSNFFDLGTCTNVGIVDRSDLSPDKHDVSDDLEAFLGVGKVGLGGLDISTEGTELWTVNLNTKALLKINIRNVSTDPLNTPSCNNISAFPIPLPCDEESRPWAVKYHHNKVYVGLVCSGENGGDLASFIYEFNPTTSAFSQIHTESLDYMKGCITPGDACTWNAWSDDFDDAIFTFGNSEIGNPQPMLSDIEFDVDGSMILGYGDRFGLQTATQNNWNFSSGTVLVSGNSGGDIRYVYNDNGTFVAEQNGNIVNANGSLVRVGCTEGGNNGGVEFFCGDERFSGSADFDHHETALGGLAFNSGTGEVVTTVIDPQFSSFANGVKYLKTIDGSSERGYSVFYNANDPEEAFGNATGIGDVELLCGVAPIEVGNRVWLDDNANGIQDIGEAIMSGITIELFQNNQLIGTTTTAADGTYYFNPSNVDGDLQPLTEYSICISAAVLGDYQTTISDSGNNDQLDNDASLNTQGNACIIFFTEEYGQNNHALDFGLKPFSCDGNLPTLPLERTGALYGITDFPTNGNEVYSWYNEAGELVQYFIGKPYYTPSEVGTYTLIVTDPDYPDCQQTFGPRTITALEGCCELED